MRRFAYLAALMVGSTVTACGGHEDPNAGITPHPQGEITSIADVVLMLHTVNAAEIQAAQLALQNASDARVRDFAQQMITDHSTADRTLMSVHGFPANNGRDSERLHPVTRELQHSARQTLENLRGYRGAAFDQTYIDNQVEMHNWALDSVHRVMLEVVDDRDDIEDDRLEQVLEELRDVLEAHLQMAVDVQSSLVR